MDVQQWGVLLPVFLIGVSLLLCIWDWVGTNATRDRVGSHTPPVAPARPAGTLPA